eukprot:3495742-Rhodomonas_salina.1
MECIACGWVYGHQRQAEKIGAAALAIHNFAWFVVLICGPTSAFWYSILPGSLPFPSHTPSTHPEPLITPTCFPAPFHQSPSPPFSFVFHLPLLSGPSSPVLSSFAHMHDPANSIRPQLVKVNSLRPPVPFSSFALSLAHSRTHLITQDWRERRVRDGPHFLHLRDHHRSLPRTLLVSSFALAPASHTFRYLKLQTMTLTAPHCAEEGPNTALISIPQTPS